MRIGFDSEMIVSQNGICANIPQECEFRVRGTTEIMNEAINWFDYSKGNNVYPMAGKSAATIIRWSPSTTECTYGSYPYGEPPYFPTYPQYYPYWPQVPFPVNHLSGRVHVARNTHGTGLSITGQSGPSWDVILPWRNNYSISQVRHGVLGQGNGCFTEALAAQHATYYTNLYDIALEELAGGYFGPPCDWITRPIISATQFYPQYTMELDWTYKKDKMFLREQSNSGLQFTLGTEQYNYEALVYDDAGPNSWDSSEEEWSLRLRVIGTGTGNQANDYTECPYDSYYDYGYTYLYHLHERFVMTTGLNGSIQEVGRRHQGSLGCGQELHFNQVPTVLFTASVLLDETAPLIIPNGQSIQIPTNTNFNWCDQIGAPESCLDADYTGHVNRYPSFYDHLTETIGIAPNPYLWDTGIEDLMIRNSFTGEYGAVLIKDYISGYEPNDIRCAYKGIWGLDPDVALPSSLMSVDNFTIGGTTEKSRAASQYFAEVAQAYLADPSVHYHSIEGDGGPAPISDGSHTIVGVMVYWEYEVFERWLMKIIEGTYLGDKIMGEVAAAQPAFDIAMNALIPPDHQGLSGVGISQGSRFGLYDYYIRSKRAADELATTNLSWDFRAWSVA